MLNGSPYRAGAYILDRGISARILQNAIVGSGENQQIITPMSAGQDVSEIRLQRLMTGNNR